MGEQSVASSGKWRVSVAAIGLAVLAAGLQPAPARAASNVTLVDPDSYTCEQSGFVDFEDLANETDLTAEAISGVQFTTTDGFTWRVGDWTSGLYNGKYPDGAYTSRGTHWAWLGEEQGRGRIDFSGGRVSYFSLLVSVGSTPVYLEAYNRKDELIDVAGPSSINIDTGLMDELKIVRDRADIDHVIVHDSGNFFLIDAVCTDSKGVSHGSGGPEWWPLRGTHKISCTMGNPSDGFCFDDKGDPYHGYAAMDINATTDDDVYAAGPGLVVDLVGDQGENCPYGKYLHEGQCPKGAKGNYVIIEHTFADGSKLYSKYLHLSSVNPDLKENISTVTRDTVLGKAGQSGLSTAGYVHLHFEVSTKKLFHKAKFSTFVDLKACVSGQLKTYPQDLGFPSWTSVPLSTEVTSDGTRCPGA